MKSFSLFSIFFFILIISPLYADDGSANREKILSFDSVVQVQKDGSLEVTEQITVYANGDQIIHGIYQDFKKNLPLGWGMIKKVDYDFNTILKNGREEPYHMDREDFEIRLYIGSRDKELTPGVYTYIIKYITGPGILFNDNYDELYLNITGNNWKFPIESASAALLLPALPVGYFIFEVKPAPYNKRANKNFVSLADFNNKFRIIDTQTIQNPLYFLKYWAYFIKLCARDTQHSSKFTFR